MADTLGLHIAEGSGADTAGRGISAVRLDAVAGAEPLVIGLGQSGPVAACVVTQDDDGAVLVGDAARRAAAGPSVTDPLTRAAGGRVGALVAIINHVVGRAVAASGAAPRRLAVVVPDDWDAAARDRVVEAGGAAGITDTVAVPRTAALAHRATVDETVAIAEGAARAASLAAAPLITREDLGETVRPRRPEPPPPFDPSTGPVSVFEADEEPEEPPPAPARPAPMPVAAAPPAAAPTRRVPPVVHHEPLRYEPPHRRIPAAMIAVAVLLGLVTAVGIALVAFDAGGDEPAEVGAPSSSPTVPATTTTAATTTTVDSTTTVEPDVTTTSEPTTTTEPTTTELTTTTTTPVPVGTPGFVTLVETGLRLDGGEVLLFGQDAEVVIMALTGLLGEPDRDGGYEETSFCFGARSRFVAWGHLELVFTEEEPESGDARFTQWFADGRDDPEGLVTISGVGVTATVGFLEATLGGSLQLVEAIEGDPTGLFAATNPGSGALLNGTTTSRDANGTVISLWAGDSCTRVFV